MAWPEHDINKTNIWWIWPMHVGPISLYIWFCRDDVLFNGRHRGLRLDIIYKVEFYSLLRLIFSVGIIIGPTAFFAQTHYIDNGLLLSLKSGYIEFVVVWIDSAIVVWIHTAVLQLSLTRRVGYC